MSSVSGLHAHRLARGFEQHGDPLAILAPSRGGPIDGAMYRLCFHGAYAAQPQTDNQGRVFSVGTGPGDPSLVLFRAAQLLRQADVMFCYNWMKDELADFVRPGVVEVAFPAGVGRSVLRREVRRIQGATARTADLDEDSADSTESNMIGYPAGDRIFLAVVVCLCLPACRRVETPSAARGVVPGLRFEGRSIELFVGSASKPATEEAAALFERQTGVKLVMHFGGSGQMLSQMKLTGRGDLYFPGSSDYMEMAKREGLVLPDTERTVVYLLPAINVAKGNPKNVQRLDDLARPGLRVGIARPDAVCVGLYAVEVFERAGLSERIRPNVVTQAESCEKTAQLVALGHVDAVLGWEVFQHWQPDKIETVFLPAEQVPRIGYIPIAVAKQAQDRELAQAFIEFLIGDEGRAVFRKWHYLTSEAEAREHVLPATPVGGEFPVPENWK